MHAAPFEYHDPGSLDEVRQLLDRRGPRTALLAGGQSLLPAMIARRTAPSAVVDLRRIAALRRIDVGAGGTVEIGAMVRHAELERSPLVRSAAPLLSAAAGLVGMRAVRTRGTIGGSLGFADPRAELPLALIVLGAELTVSATDGEWSGPIEQWRPAARRRAGDVLVRVHVPPAAAHEGTAIRETTSLARGFATAAVAVRVRGDAHGTIVDATAAAAALAPTPVVLTEVTDALLGRPLSDPFGGSVAAALAADLAGLDPPSDLHGSGAYRRHAASVLARRAIEDAARKAADGGG